MKFNFHKAAEKEFFATSEFLEKCQLGLGL